MSGAFKNKEDFFMKKLVALALALVLVMSGLRW